MFSIFISEDENESLGINVEKLSRTYHVVIEDKDNVVKANNLIVL